MDPAENESKGKPVVRLRSVDGDCAQLVAEQCSPACTSGHNLRCDAPRVESPVRKAVPLLLKTSGT